MADELVLADMTEAGTWKTTPQHLQARSTRASACFARRQSTEQYRWPEGPPRHSLPHRSHACSALRALMTARPLAELAAEAQDLQLEALLSLRTVSSLPQEMQVRTRSYAVRERAGTHSISGVGLTSVRTPVTPGNPSRYAPAYPKIWSVWTGGRRLRSLRYPPCPPEGPANPQENSLPGGVCRPSAWGARWRPCGTLAQHTMPK